MLYASFHTPHLLTVHRFLLTFNYRLQLVSKAAKNPSNFFSTIGIYFLNLWTVFRR
jgi:hypothetical protein